MVEGKVLRGRILEVLERRGMGSQFGAGGAFCGRKVLH